MKHPLDLYNIAMEGRSAPKSAMFHSPKECLIVRISLENERNAYVLHWMGRTKKLNTSRAKMYKLQYSSHLAFGVRNCPIFLTTYNICKDSFKY